MEGDPARPAPRGRPRAARDADHGGDHRLRGRVAVRPLDARGPAARRDPLLDRRRGRLLAAARHRPAPQAVAHARGRGRLQRPDRRAARDRLHRLDQGAAATARRHARAVRPAARASGSSSAWPFGRLSRCWPSGRAALLARPLPGRVAGDGRARVRLGRRAARLRLPRRLPRGARARHRQHPRQAHGDRVPRGARVGRRSSAMFLTLGLLVFPSALLECRARGDAAGAASSCSSPGRSRRPSSLARRRLQRPGEQALLGWAGLRGAVPVVLATSP